MRRQRDREGFNSLDIHLQAPNSGKSRPQLCVPMPRALLRRLARLAEKRGAKSLSAFMRAESERLVCDLFDVADDARAAARHVERVARGTKAIAKRLASRDIDMLAQVANFTGSCEPIRAPHETRARIAHWLRQSVAKVSPLAKTVEALSDEETLALMEQGRKHAEAETDIT